MTENRPQVCPESTPDRRSAADSAAALRESNAKAWVRNQAGWVAALFLIVLGVKFCLLQHVGTPLPFWDQWDGEGADIYKPYLEGHLTLADLFRAHNEHRIFFTHLYDLILLCLNGQWDNQLQSATNAFIHSAWVAGFAVLLAGAIGRQSWPFVWLALAAVELPPFAWENVVGGMDCQFYFLLVASWLAIWCLALAEPFSWRWWLGLAAAIAALFTMASGLLAGATAAGLAVFEILKDRRNWRRGAPTIAVGAAIALAGVLMLPHAQHVSTERPHSPQEFFVALGQNLAWPWVIHPWCGLANLFPLAALAWAYFRSLEKRRPAELLVLGTGLWVVLQATATAIGRGGEGTLPASRYMDTLGMLAVANILAIVLLMTRYQPRLKYQPIWTAFFAMWSVIFACGWLWLSENTWYNSVPTWMFYRDARLQNMRAFRATDNPQVFTDAPFFCRPFPNVQQLVQLLRDPVIRKILPSCVGDPLRIEPGTGSDETFQTNACAPYALPAERCWGSYSGPGVAARGKFESLPVSRPNLPFLEIRVVGNLGAPGLSLDLIDLATGNDTRVKSAPSDGDGWRSVFVKAPAGDFKVVARDDSATGWFAFKEPRQMGRFSYWAMRAIAAWAWFLVAGLLCLVLQSALFIVNLRQAKARHRTV
jgi:hypothetical protein